MAQFEHKNGSGSLFKSEKKNPNSPDYSGSLRDHSGKEWRLAGWIKEGQKGKFLSISMSEQTASNTVGEGRKNGGDDLPF